MKKMIGVNEVLLWYFKDNKVVYINSEEATKLREEGIKIGWIKKSEVEAMRKFEEEYNKKHYEKLYKKYLE